MRKKRYDPATEKKIVEAEIQQLDLKWEVFMRECLESTKVDQSKFLSFIYSYMRAWKSLSKITQDMYKSKWVD